MSSFHEGSTATASSTSIGEDLSKMSISKTPVKFQGSGGKVLNVTSNYLRLEIPEDAGIYEYEVRFAPNVDMRNERFRLIKQAEPVIGATKVRLIRIIDHFL